MKNQTERPEPPLCTQQAKGLVSDILLRQESEKIHHVTISIDSYNVSYLTAPNVLGKARCEKFMCMYDVRSTLLLIKIIMNLRRGKSICNICVINYKVF